MDSLVETAAIKPADSSHKARKPEARSRVSNGSALLVGVDGRSAWVRRCRDLIAEHTSDLGGVDNCSAAERSIVRRISVMTVELERLETKFALAGEASADDLDLYQRTAGACRRLFEAIGVKRRAKPVQDLYEVLPQLQQPSHELNGADDA